MKALNLFKINTPTKLAEKNLNSSWLNIWYIDLKVETIHFQKFTKPNIFSYNILRLCGVQKWFDIDGGMLSWVDGPRWPGTMICMYMCNILGQLIGPIYSSLNIVFGVAYYLKLLDAKTIYYVSCYLTTKVKLVVSTLHNIDIVIYLVIYDDESFKLALCNS